MPDEFLSESLQMYLSLLEIDENASSFDDMFHVPLFSPPQKKLRKILLLLPFLESSAIERLLLNFMALFFLSFIVWLQNNT